MERGRECWEWAQLRCADDVEFLRPRYGVWKDFFMFTLRVQRHLRKGKLGHCGFRMMHKTLWQSTPSEACEHLVEHDLQVYLPPGCKTMNNICYRGYGEINPRMTVCLTAHDMAA